MDEKALLLWDGECAFCEWCVGWAEARDSEKKIRALPYQRAPSPPMTDALRARCQRAVQLVLPDGRILSAGRAVLGVVSLLGWRRTAATLSFSPLAWAVEAIYWFIARNRNWALKLFKKRK